MGLRVGGDPNRKVSDLPDQLHQLGCVGEVAACRAAVGRRVPRQRQNVSYTAGGVVLQQLGEARFGYAPRR